MGALDKIGKIYQDFLLLLAIGSRHGSIPNNISCMTLIETTSICNLACPLCPTGTGELHRKSKFIHPDDFSRIVDLTYQKTQGYTLSMWGEPLLHPSFVDLLDQVKSKIVWISTNLNIRTGMIEALCNYKNLKIICSIDSHEKESYLKYRVNGDFKRVVENLEILAKGDCEVFPQFLIDDENKHETTAYRDFITELNIPSENIVFKQKYGNIKNEKHALIKGVCHSPYLCFYFNCDAYLVPCCMNIKSDLWMKHISEIDSAEDLYRDDAFADMRIKLSKNKNHFPSCHACPGISHYSSSLKRYGNYLRRRVTGEIPETSGFDA